MSTSPTNRPYNSATDKPILEQAIRRVGLAGVFLTECRKDLLAAGIRWATNFNNDQDPVTKAMSIDMTSITDAIMRERVHFNRGGRSE